MNYCSKTDIGRKRERNEDFCVSAKLSEDAALFVVCDGMGGEAGGAIASKLAAESFVDEVKYQSESRIENGKLYFAEPETEIPMMLDSALANANFEVWQKAQDEPELRRMGTTLVAALVFSSPLRVFTVNIGDSRAYRIIEADAQRITNDHSYVQELVDNGEITLKEAATHKNRNIITRAVGISIRAEGDIKEAEINDGEMLLLCTDGLTGMLSDDEIHGVLTYCEAPLETKLDRLVSLANDAGGDDNITAILVSL